MILNEILMVLKTEFKICRVSPFCLDAREETNVDGAVVTS